MGKPCVAGARGIKIDAKAATLTIGDTVIHEGDMITLDGSTGEVFASGLKLIPPQINADFQEVLSWADEIRRLGVEANADNATDAAKLASWVPRASGCAAPSTCSSVLIVCRPCTR
ncbi:pyruvate, phosphate dikinase [Cutibacterium acnes JCM 18918]|nr:pyruvate, phosphate dikinase [Cutibacterium acnes JCM 18918]